LIRFSCGTGYTRCVACNNREPIRGDGKNVVRYVGEQRQGAGGAELEV
jgi:hypothetical protein